MRTTPPSRLRRDILARSADRGRQPLRRGRSSRGRAGAWLDSAAGRAYLARRGAIHRRAEADALLRRPARGGRRKGRRPLRVGPEPARSRRVHLHRPARSRGHRAGDVRSAGGRRGVLGGGHGAAGMGARGARRRPRPRGDTQPAPSDGRGRGRRARGGRAEQVGDAAVPHRGRDRHERGQAARVPLPRPAEAEAAARAPHALEDGDDHAAVVYGERLRRGRDAVSGEVHAGRGAQLPRAIAARARKVLRARGEPAALQAAPDGRGLRPLLPDREVLPRRGPAHRPAARVHAGRRGDELRRAG